MHARFFTQFTFFAAGILMNLALVSAPARAATIQEVSDSTGQVITRIWTALQGGYLLKWVGIAGAVPPKVRLEVSALSFEKPRAGLLAVPAKCAKPAPPSPTP